MTPVRLFEERKSIVATIEVYNALAFTATGI
jgi:hypothetical protein